MIKKLNLVPPRFDTSFSLQQYLFVQASSCCFILHHHPSPPQRRPDIRNVPRQMLGHWCVSKHPEGQGQSRGRSHVLWFPCTLHWTNYKFDRTISIEIIAYFTIVPEVHICHIHKNNDGSWFILMIYWWSHLLDKLSTRLARARHLDVGEEAICTWPFGCGRWRISSGPSGRSSVKSCYFAKKNLFFVFDWRLWDRHQSSGNPLPDHLARGPAEGHVRHNIWYHSMTMSNHKLAVKTWKLHIKTHIIWLNI